MSTEKNILHYETTAPKDKPAVDDPLAFGTIFTDHMFVMDYTDGTGWHDPRIEPVQAISSRSSCNRVALWTNCFRRIESLFE